jgi:hypothetical protein
VSNWFSQKKKKQHDRLKSERERERELMQSSMSTMLVKNCVFGSSKRIIFISMSRQTTKETINDVKHSKDDDRKHSISNSKWFRGQTMCGDKITEREVGETRTEVTLPAKGEMVSERQFNSKGRSCERRR